uniref:DnaJ homolog subfamily C member 2 n=1 Tax=Araucaria cunninghamii TaxID=56994 RepID=A0A0D6R2D9_ARACU
MTVPGNLALLTYSDELEDGKPLYVSSNCLPVKATKLEPAGSSFHAAVLRSLGYKEEADDENDDKSESDEKDKGFTASYDSYKSKGKKKSGSGKEQQDHYALLGLSQLRFLATEDQIRKAYREAALKHHPDKQASLLLAEETEEAKQSKKDEIESHFKAIQEAYEILIDPVKRRIYDSTDEFDDEVPSDCAPQDFFKVFGPVFMRNSRWSVTQPIPPIGDENAPIKEVDKFYDFWYSFKTWREFPQDDEFDLEQAESRDHRRWMEKQNAKIREKSRKEEYARIRMLVDNAYKKDPRILRRKEEEKAEKLRKKEMKFQARRLKEEEEARIAEEERIRKEEEGKKAKEAALAQKKSKEKEKKQLRKEKSRLRTACARVVSKAILGISEDDVEKLCTSLDLDRLRNLCDQMEHKEEHQRAQLLRDALANDAVANKPGEKAVPQNDSEQDKSISRGIQGCAKVESLLDNREKKEKPWSKEEVDLLRKGLQKYPKGTSQRWEVISNYIGTGRTVEEILKAIKTVLLQKPDSTKAFDSFLEKRKPVNTIESPLTTREEVGGFPENGIVNGTHVEEKSKHDVIEQQASPGSSQNSDRKGVSGRSVQSVSNGSVASNDQDSWSVVQERALIQALKTFPKDTAQRWERVATAVPGKTKVQCMKKFSELKDNFRNKKNAE